MFTGTLLAQFWNGRPAGESPSLAAGETPIG
jgi:hypothetical protein